MTDIHSAVRDGVARAVTASALGAVALIHLLDAPGKFEETPYLGWMYVALIVGSLVTGFALVRGSDTRAWLAAGGLAAGALVGYAVNRTVGLPQATGDIGNWAEPIGMASLLVEAIVVAVSGDVLVARAQALSAPSRAAGERSRPDAPVAG
jgi:hypothetical protein